MSGPAVSTLVDINPLNAPYWQSLANGRLSYQRCRSCGHSWLPARPQCPSCLHADWEWTPASGKARLISWVVYHHAYHESFAARLPYTVTVVELDEGPRMTSNIVGVDDPEKLKIDQRLCLKIESEGNACVPRFTPAGEE
jgi:uncharacterized OB-fold protein